MTNARQPAVAQPPPVVKLRHDRRAPMLFAAIVCAAAVPRDCACQDGQPPSANSPAVAAARARQQRVKTAEIELQVTEIVGKGAISDGLPAMMSKGNSFPREETKLESTNRLLMSGDFTRYEDNHPIWNTDRQEAIKNCMISAYNGDAGRVFLPLGLGKGKELAGIIDGARRNERMKGYALTPITMAFRALDANIAPYPIANFSPTGASLTVDGVKCDEYKPADAGTASVTIWTDPAKDHVIRRLQRRNGQRLAEQQDIFYEQDAAVGWVPKSWTRTTFTKDGRAGVSAKAVVSSAFFNRPLASSAFELEFPSGTFVHEQGTGKNHRVQPNGSMRAVSATGEDLAPDIAETQDSWLAQRPWLLVLVGVFLALALAWALWRRSRLRSIQG